jgi:hypothetical protein
MVRFLSFARQVKLFYSIQEYDDILSKPTTLSTAENQGRVEKSISIQTKKAISITIIISCKGSA